MKRIIVLSLVAVFLFVGVADAKPRPAAVRGRAAKRVAVVAPKTYQMVWFVDGGSNTIFWSDPDLYAGRTSYPTTDSFVFRVPARPYSTVTAVTGTVQSVAVVAGQIVVKVAPVWDNGIGQASVTF